MSPQGCICMVSQPAGNSNQISLKSKMKDTVDNVVYDMKIGQDGHD